MLLLTLEPESSASANSATLAYSCVILAHSIFAVNKIQDKIKIVLKLWRMFVKNQAFLLLQITQLP